MDVMQPCDLDEVFTDWIPRVGSSVLQYGNVQDRT